MPTISPYRTGHTPAINPGISDASSLQLSYIERQLESSKNTNLTIRLSKHGNLKPSKTGLNGLLHKSQNRHQKSNAAEFFVGDRSKSISFKTALQSVRAELEHRKPKVETTIKTPEERLGQCIGRGGEAEVYLDKFNPTNVIKKYHHDISKKDCVSQVNAFNKFYGENAASLVPHNGILYMVMPKISGTPLSDLPENSLPINAGEKFLEMIASMQNKKIVHCDLSEGNVLYDRKTNSFNPIDFGDSYELISSGGVKARNALEDYQRSVEYTHGVIASKMINNT